MAKIDEAMTAKENADKAIAQITDRPIVKGELFKNDLGYKDKGMTLNDTHGCITSAYETQLSLPSKSFPQKRGVKLTYKKPDEMYVEPCTSNADVVGMCTFVDKPTGYAQVVPLTSGRTDWFVCKKNAQIVAGDMLKFVAGGELDKEAGTPTVYIKALSAPVKRNEELYLVKAVLGGFRAKP